MANSQTDVVVIGAGPAGYVCAIRLAQLGKKVTVVEKAEVGGVCLNRGCIPSKALIHAGTVYEKISHSDEMGISVKGADLDFKKLMTWKGEVVKKLTGGQWGREHPILKTIADSAPVGVGGVIGGALGSHFAGGHKVASASEYLLRKAVQNAPQMVSEKRRLDVLPERMKMVEYALANNIPMGQVHLP